ncbi:GGDEF domain-containing protein [Bosea caraganae]|uniref:diguanylate cyclase n=1 Tax=Bosea caraganae TaxID=2763117 RepID=A0A370L5R8_9HYPH|nr:GGDEF domain-containing protein [Bosea caraganae]RDJ24310.1 GGDEF domain-containing protein [Bosea caraganae]RDJ30353.1 GGDEF domain-containing protein [Bosea caraganae]
MPLDYNSLLIAIGFSSAGLALTFFTSWLVAKTERFLMTWSVGLALIVVATLIYAAFLQDFAPILGATGFSVLLMGLVVVMAAGRQFRTGRLPVKTMALSAALSIAPMAVPMLTGYTGIAFIALNLGATAILFATAWDYWLGRAEARTPILLLAVLYALTGVSFAACAVVLVYERQWIIHEAPVNWVENLNLAVSLASTAGIGALSLALNQSRLARGHKLDAETDALTGLFNRRALFGKVPVDLAAPVAAIVFDVDQFKRVNDVHGHQAGDEVLRVFGELLAANTRRGDIAARLGGEEFALILPETSLDEALMIAERVRTRISRHGFASPAGALTCTVSAGVAGCDVGRTGRDELLRAADAALYSAKRAGRNRVVNAAADTGHDVGRVA